MAETTAEPRRRIALRMGRGHKKKAATTERPRSNLVVEMLRWHDGAWIADEAHHRGSRARPLATYAASAIGTLSGAVWLFAHPGPYDLVRIGAWLLLLPAGLSLGTAIMAALAPLDAETIKRLVRGARGVATAIDVGVSLLVAVTAVIGIVLAAFAAHYDGRYDTTPLRTVALTSALMAAGLGVMARGGLAPLFSVVKARPLPLSHVTLAVPRITVIASIFITAAEAAAPAKTTWWPIASALVLAAIGWEMSSFRPSRETALNRIADAALDVQEAARDGGTRMVSALGALESACLRKVAGDRRIVEGDIAYVIRACLERADPWEQLTYPANSELMRLRRVLSGWGDEEFFAEAGRFAAALRHALLLHTPL